MTAPKLALLAIALLPTLGRAEDCTFNIAFKIQTQGKAATDEVEFSGITIATSDCGQELKEGARFKFGSGTFNIEGKLPAPMVIPGGITTAVVWLDRGTFTVADVASIPDKGRLTIGSVDHDDVPVEGEYFTAKRANDSHSFSVGPASSAKSDGATDAASAFRLQYRYAYASTLGAKQAALLSTAVSIDTTNRSSSDYMDDNSVSLKVQGGNYRAGDVFAGVQFFGEALYARAVHSRTSNADAGAGVSFRMPFAPAFSLFRRGTGRFIAPPLSVALSYGYRWHDAPDQQADDGGVFKGSALYHFYLFGKFRVDLQYDYTHNDFSEPSTTDPQTQRMYRGTIAYLVKDRFQVKTSYEDGSIGPVLTKIKQYFIGVAFSDGF